VSCIIQLPDFSDTDWGGSLDTNHSMTGYCFFLGDSITGLLEIQEAANSSKVLIRGRILSLSSATCELQLLLFLLQDLSITFPNNWWSDAITKVPCTSQPNPFSREDQASRDYFHVIREKCMDGLMPLLPLYTTDQTEDLYTKSLHPKHF